MHPEMRDNEDEENDSISSRDKITDALSLVKMIYLQPRLIGDEVISYISSSRHFQIKVFIIFKLRSFRKTYIQQWMQKLL